MRYQFTLALVPALLWGPYAHGSVNEKEQNNLAETSALVGGPTVYVTQTLDAHGNVVDPDDPSLIEANPDAAIKPTPFALTDEMIGQLSGTRDYDWYYLDVSDSSRPVTPVYFECNYRFGFYYEGPGNSSGIDPKDVTWQVNYYYDPDPKTPGGAKLAGSHIVSQENCKQGTATTKGPLRFQMNTDRPGRYYVRIWGRLIQVVEQKETIGGVEIKKYIDEVVAPTGPYSLRVYTTRVDGELEPNDGVVEAYKLTSGTAVTSQLASMYDEDWFYVDNDITKNATKKLPFYFNCKGQTGTFYAISAYNKDGVLQSKYEIKAEQCNGAGGFSFTIDAPVSARYYFEVSSPTFTEPDQFTQSDYSVLVVASGQESEKPPETPARKDGDLEPNEKSIDAYPLPKNVGVTAQLASNIDQDWFVINYVAEPNSTGTTAVYFDCKGLSNSAAVFEISAYNPQKVLQSNYTVSAEQCAVTGGFKFSLPTPATGTYFILVNSPANTDPKTFSQSDYTLRWAPVIADGQGGTGTGGSGAATRKDGELEPNERPVDAYPLTNIQAVTAQLSSTEDLDYFYYDNGGSAQATPIYFRCWLPVDENGAPISSTIYTLSAYNSQGVLQNTYTVDASQCVVPGGFKFDLATPAAERYYVAVAGPVDQDPENFSNADYTLSTFLNLAAEGSGNVAGSLKSALLLDRTAAGKDSFTAKVGRCGSNKGVVKLTGNKLNLGKQDKNAQIKVQIGTWSCVSDPKEFTITTPNANTKAYAYPKPPAAVKKPKTSLSGGAG
jgi:hypothetical protein